MTCISYDDAVTSRQKNAPISFRASDENRRLLKAIATTLGLSQTAALEFMIRDYARRNRIKPESDEQADRTQDTKTPYTAADPEE
jgi:hypothetical protein